MFPLQPAEKEAVTRCVYWDFERWVNIVTKFIKLPRKKRNYRFVILQVPTF